jgi:hypothetical protein
VLKNRKYTTEESYLYKILNGEEIDVDWAVKYGHLEVVKYLYSKRGSATSCNIDRPKTKATEEGINWAVEYGHLEIVKYLYSQEVKATEKIALILRLEIVT